MGQNFKLNLIIQRGNFRNQVKAHIIFFLSAFNSSQPNLNKNIVILCDFIAIQGEIVFLSFIPFIPYTSILSIFDMVRTVLMIPVSETVPFIYNIIIPRKITDVGKTVNLRGEVFTGFIEIISKNDFFN